MVIILFSFPINSGLPRPYLINNNTMMFQDQNGKILKESFGFHYGVKMVAFACSSKLENDESIKPAYDEKVQKYLRKQYNSVVNPELNEQNQQKTKLYEQNRAKEEQRLEQKRKHDQIRDKIRDKHEPRLEHK